MSAPAQKRKPQGIPPIHKIIKVADYHITTWLLLGACLQCFLVAVLPRKVALLPPIIVLLYRITRGYLAATGYIHNKIADGVHHEYMSSTFPAADGTLTAAPENQSIVVLVLASSFTHPNGRFSPGAPQIGAYFRKMWRDAEVQRDKYGFLGNTPGLVAEYDGVLNTYGPKSGSEEGRVTVYLSYWKTLDGLHAFAHGEAHRKGWLWWEGGAGKKFKHIGIMHEVYEAPAGHWENIFHNFKPFGIGE